MKSSLYISKPQYLIHLIEKSQFLLKESVAFMNLVPNRKYGDNYELCSRIDKFFKELE